MTAQTRIRAASLTSAAYGALLASGIVYHFQRTASMRALVNTLSHPAVWVALLVAALVTIGLWRRQAWAWWLGVAAACYEVFVIVSAWFSRGFGRVPGVPALIALALLVLLLVLLLPRRSRLGCNR